MDYWNLHLPADEIYTCFFYTLISDLWHFSHTDQHQASRFNHSSNKATILIDPRNLITNKQYFKHSLIVFISAILLLSTRTIFSADHLLSYNLTMASDYHSRGISQTSNKAAVQIAIDYYHLPSGFLGGIWISNVDSSKQGFDGSHFETDLYLGWGHIWKNTTVKLLAYQYQYFNTRIKDYNTNEYWFIVNQDFKQFIIEATATHSDDWYGFGRSHYYIGKLTIPLPDQLSVSARYGRNTFNHPLLENYSDYEIGVSHPFYGVDISLSYIANTINKTYCYEPFNCESSVVLSLSKGF